MTMETYDYADSFDGLECDALDRMDTDSLLSVLYADASHADVAAWAENSIEQVTP